MTALLPDVEQRATWKRDLAKKDKSRHEATVRISGICARSCRLQLVTFTRECFRFTGSGELSRLVPRATSDDLGACSFHDPPSYSCGCCGLRPRHCHRAHLFVDAILRYLALICCLPFQPIPAMKHTVDLTLAWKTFGRHFRTRFPGIQYRHHERPSWDSTAYHPWRSVTTYMFSQAKTTTCSVYSTDRSTYFSNDKVLVFRSKVPPSHGVYILTVNHSEKLSENSKELLRNRVQLPEI
jgi:hypothetical protein